MSKMVSTNGFFFVHLFEKLLLCPERYGYAVFSPLHVSMDGGGLGLTGGKESWPWNKPAQDLHEMHTYFSLVQEARRVPSDMCACSL
eukprot:3940155-Amphidinium_carterae.1